MPWERRRLCNVSAPPTLLARMRWSGMVRLPAAAQRSGNPLRAKEIHDVLHRA